ncbi:MAG: prolyl oligopeptidase family serine peptidase [Chromatiales bacterium]|nr:prolyl oligopeptidase family serine peptidase [Chromatiales bacterium]
MLGLRFSDAEDEIAWFDTRLQEIGSRARAALPGLIPHIGPVNRAAEIRTPILLIHGPDDRFVPLAQSQVTTRALARAGKPHGFLEIKGGDHSLLRGDHRLAAFTALDRFLAEHLAGDPAR